MDEAVEYPQTSYNWQLVYRRVGEGEGEGGHLPLPAP